MMTMMKVVKGVARGNVKTRQTLPSPASPSPPFPPSPSSPLPLSILIAA